jgi:hypothetical protein
MQAVDQAMCFIQVAPQNPRDGVLAGVAASTRAPASGLGGFELV